MTATTNVPPPCDPDRFKWRWDPVDAATPNALPVTVVEW